jgi:hypothetical protein
VKKKKVIERLLLESSLSTKSDYFKQYAILRKLLEAYPDQNFWNVVNFGRKLKSLYFFKIRPGKQEIEAKYKEFKYQPKGKDIKLTLGKKYGSDKYSSKKIQTIKNFLND